MVVRILWNPGITAEFYDKISEKIKIVREKIRRRLLENSILFNISYLIDLISFLNLIILLINISSREDIGNL